MFDEKMVEKEEADIVITPVIKQLLPYFVLVSGQEDAVRLAKLLNAKYLSLCLCSCTHAICHGNNDGCSCFPLSLSLCRFVVPMRNGELESKGALTSIIKSQGTMESFKVIFFPSEKK